MNENSEASLGMEIIARKREQKKLEELYSSPQSELIAVYGRRRVGKTYLIRNFFTLQDCIYFELIGQKMENGDVASLSTQLANFQFSYKTAFQETITKPKNWEDAFFILKTKINQLKDKGEKIIIFLDEFPWLCSPNSKFYENFDQAWNACLEPAGNVKVIICGSAATWMLKRIIYATGGLSRRVTCQIHLAPFNLSETSDYLKFKNFDLTQESVAETYMILGGIPYYLNFLSPKKSLYQNIEDECFRSNGNLIYEFDIMFDSLFRNSENYKYLMEIISEKRTGLTIEGIQKKCKKESSNSLYQMLDNLEQCNFVKKRIPLYNKKKGALYSVIDEYTLFHLKWIKPLLSSISQGGFHFRNIQSKQGYKIWLGFSFEMLCLKHEESIKRALGFGAIHAVSGSYYAYDEKTKKRVAQIDLLFDRADKTITVCELKWHERELELDQTDLQSLRKKKEALLKYLQIKRIPVKNILIAFITMRGVKKNAIFNELQPEVLALDDLFSD